MCREIFLFIYLKQKTIVWEEAIKKLKKEKHLKVLLEKAVRLMQRKRRRKSKLVLGIWNQEPAFRQTG